MPSLIDKLQLKAVMSVVVAGEPAGVQVLKDALGDLAIQSEVSPETLAYIGFAVTLAQLEAHGRQVAKMEGPDPLVWIAYPKQSSKRYRCEFNRDTGWEGLGALGFEPVRQVAIDEDWSALRFRRVERIGKMTRSFAMTEQGKQKVEESRQEPS